MTPSPSASQVLEGSTPVVTGPVCGVVVVPLESVLAMLLPLWRRRLFPRVVLAVGPPVVASSAGCGGGGPGLVGGGRGGAPGGGGGWGPPRRGGRGRRPPGGG